VSEAFEDYLETKIDFLFTAVPLWINRLVGARGQAKNNKTFGGSNKASIAQNSSTWLLAGCGRANYCLRPAIFIFISGPSARVQNCSMSDECFFLPNSPFNYPADSYIYLLMTGPRLAWVSGSSMTQKFSHRGRASRMEHDEAKIVVNHSRSANFVESKMDGNERHVAKTSYFIFDVECYFGDVCQSKIQRG
jgi:hypothetical protein